MKYITKIYNKIIKTKTEIKNELKYKKTKINSIVKSINRQND